MTEFHGMSAQEIASELAVPVNTVYSRLRLARQQLHAQVARPELLLAWRDASQLEHVPPRGQAQRTWAVLLPALGPGKLAALGLGAAGSLRAAMATTLLAAGVVTVGLASPRGAPAASPATLLAPRSSEPPPPTTAVDAAAGPPTPPAPRAAARVLAPRTAHAATAGAEDRLREEVTLLDRADVHLAAAAPETALRVLDEHARRFPDGALADVREATRVRSLCAQGELDAAAALAARLPAVYPDSALARQFVGYRCRR